MRSSFHALLAGLLLVGAFSRGALAGDGQLVPSEQVLKRQAVPLVAREWGTPPECRAHLWRTCALRSPDAAAPEPAFVERRARPEWIRVADSTAKPSSSGGDQGGGAGNLAMQLSNPLAALISVPFQANLDEGYGPGSTGYRWTINIQPVVPFRLSSQWNLISRTILPVIIREGLLPNEDNLVGLGDVVQSFWFSPNKTKPLVWGVGPVFLLPTATDDRLGADKFGGGLTVIALKQSGPWTYGVHANHIWSYEDIGRRGTLQNPKINTTFLQPFLAYNFPSAFGLTLQTEAIYDWDNDVWSVPLILSCSQVTAICRQPVSLSLGFKYWAETPDGGPEWGVRLGITFLFPKK